MSDDPKPAPDAPTPEPTTPAAPSAKAPPPTGADHLAERDGTQMTEIEVEIVEALKTIFDPEIPVNIVELGLIYGVEVDKDTGNVDIEMTLTTPACPVAGTLPGEVETKVKTVEGVNEVVVELVWDPPWSMERLSEAAKLTLGVG